MYVVGVKFFVKEGFIDLFQEAMLMQAKHSLELEDNCVTFTVSTAKENPAVFFLYEEYNNEQDFEAHLQSKHFLSFSEKTASWITSKEIECFERLY